MKKAIGLLLGVCMLALGTQAHALYTLDFTSLGGNAYNNITALELSGGGTVEQFTPGGFGDIAVGNTFIQTTTNPFMVEGTGYFVGVTFTSPLTPPDFLGLRVVDGDLDGVLTSEVVGLGFSYEYTPGDVVEFVYDDGVTETILANITMTKGGGFNFLNDTIGFSTGTFNIEGIMDVLVDNVIFINGVDAFDELGPLTIALATYDGSINLGDPFDANAASFKQDVFIGGEMVILATPEPATMTLLGLGALGAAFLRRRNRRSN